MTSAETVADLAATNLMDPELFKDGPPHEVFSEMRAHAPVLWHPRRGVGDGFWSVTRAADIASVSKRSSEFSSHAGGVFIRDDAPLPLDVVRSVMLGMDPPEHTRYRVVVQSVFTPGRIAELEAGIRVRVERILDSVCEQGVCDLVAEVAVELPLQTIAEILGVPQDDRKLLLDWTNRVEAASNGGDDGMVAFAELAMYLASLVEQRRREPTPDLLSALVHAEIDGESLSDLELYAFFGLLMFAGNDTTRNTISGGVQALLSDLDQYGLLRSNLALVPDAVEEMLRWVTPVMWFCRTAIRDTEIAGVPIAEGDKVVLWYSSGSRDELVVDEPMVFDVTREGVNHQAFGGGGRHFCLGSGLARLQIRVLIEEMMVRLPDLRLVGDQARVASTWVNGLEFLPVRFTPTAKIGGAHTSSTADLTGSRL